MWSVFKSCQNLMTMDFSSNLRSWDSITITFSIKHQESPKSSLILFGILKKLWKGFMRYRTWTFKNFKTYFKFISSSYSFRYFGLWIILRDIILSSQWSHGLTMLWQTMSLMNWAELLKGDTTTTGAMRWRSCGHYNKYWISHLKLSILQIMSGDWSG